MITGFDTVIVGVRKGGPAVVDFLDGWASRWPNMLVAIDESSDENFADWREVRNQIPVDEAEVYVARDAIMINNWNEFGYDIPDEQEGPLLILYQPCTVRTFAAQATSNPYVSDSQFGFEPYSVTFVGAGLTLVTLVSPDAGSEFTATALSSLVTALAVTQ